MRSILDLFEVTKKDKNYFPKNKFIKDISDFPVLNCPKIGSSLHNKDMQTVNKLMEKLK